MLSSEFHLTFDTPGKSAEGVLRPLRVRRLGQFTGG
jgi:hypothetical protein